MGGGKKGKKSKKKKSYTKAQKMAKARIAAGKTISSVKASNKQKMKDAATARHAKFKQTRVQTFGGTRKTSFTKAEQKRITDAGYSVAGYSKAKPNVGAGTGAMVAADNAQYGTSVPEGSFSISEAGQAEAAANKQEKAAADMAARSQNMFSPSSGTNYGGITAGRLGTTFGDIFSNPKFMYQGNFAGRAPGVSNYFATNPNVAATYTRPGGLKGIPFAKGDVTGSLTRFRVPEGAKITRNMTGFQQLKLNPSQMKNLGIGLTVAGDDVAGVAAKSAGKFGIKTLGKFGARAIPFAGAGLSIADSISRFREGDYTGAALAAGSAIPGPVGWASLGGLAAKDIASAMSTQPTTPSGGLNVGAAANASETGGETSEGSNTGRAITSTSRDNLGIGDYNPKAVAGRIFGGGIDKLTGDRTDYDNLGTAAENKNLSPTQKFEQFKKDPLQQAVFTAQTGINADRIINEGGPAAKEIYNNYISRIDTSTAQKTRRPIAELFRDTAGKNQTDATAMAGRAISAYSVDDPNFADKPNQLTQQLARFGVPQLSEENVQDLRHTFDTSITKDTGIPGKGLTNIPYSQALGFANRITAGKIKDGVDESLNQLGMKNVPTLDDAVALGSQFKTNMNTEGTVTAQRMAELDALYKKYGPGGGQAPTIPSILQKTIGGRTGSSRSTTTTRGTGTTAPATTPQELLIQQTPTYTAPTQTGTDTSNLQQIQQQSYMQNLAQLGITNLMQLPQFRTQQQRAPRRFRSFRRDYF